MEFAKGILIMLICIAVVGLAPVLIDAAAGALIHRWRVRQRLKALRDNPHTPDPWGLRE